MARHVVRREAREGAAEGAVPADKAPMVGGTSGMPPDPNAASPVIHGMNAVVPAREVRAREDEPKMRRFTVVGGPDSVMYDGQRVLMRHGKVYAEGACDLDLLRRQGVRLEEILEEVP